MNKEIEEKVDFDELRAHEEVILVAKQHPYKMFRPGIVLLLGVGIAVDIVIIGQINGGIGKIALICALLSASIGLIYFWYRLFLFKKDIFILTNQRIIKVDRKGLFKTRVSQTVLENIYNINYEIKGMVKTMLNFGDIQISTVGDEISTIVVSDVENPHFVQEKILSEHRKDKMRYKNLK